MIIKNKKAPNLVSLVVPVYNEEDNVDHFYAIFLNFLKNTKFVKNI